MIDPFEIYQKIHFIGIGGIGISALARLLKHKKHIISGSDQTRSHNIDLLLEEGIEISIGHTTNSMPKDTELAIYTSAMPDNNPEIALAKKLSIPLLTYPQAIGQLTKKVSTVSICGTHGKTTITALLGHALRNINLDPSVIVGSLVKEFNNKNMIVGEGDLLILESCEYHNAFLNYSPKIIILNNIEPEHLDFFHNSENYLDAFRKFINKLPPDGSLIANGDDPNVQILIKEKTHAFKITTFGREKTNSYHLQNDKVVLPNGEIIQLKLNIPGKHNLLNATAVIAVCQALNAEESLVAGQLHSFLGAARRLELKGQTNNIPIIDDYGHTPAEIRATLNALKSKYGETSRILCIFQPHQYSRTHYFLNEFAKSFADATKVYIPNIYRSRDNAEDMAKVNVDILVNAINSESGDKAQNTYDFPTTIRAVKEHIKDFDVILTIGAGDITRLGGLLLSNKSKAHQN